MNKSACIYCFGELLWDCFPDKEILGGAPFNVAHRLYELGAEVTMLSAVGNDARGKSALEHLVKKGLSIAHVSMLSDLPTGNVKVTLDKQGSASYQIAKGVAWDFIDIKKLPEIDRSILVFGSLALRDAFNRKQLEALLEKVEYALFDINLRPPHYDLDYLVSLLPKCDAIKLNEEELPIVLETLKLSGKSLEDQLKELAVKVQIETICVTLGSRGAVLWHQGSFYSHPGFVSKVVDTVGAGDSFLAGFIFSFYVNQQSPQDALAVGCALGSLVASKAGATANIKAQELKDLLNQK